MVRAQTVGKSRVYNGFKVNGCIFFISTITYIYVGTRHYNIIDSQDINCILSSFIFRESSECYNRRASFSLGNTSCGSG